MQSIARRAHVVVSAPLAVVLPGGGPRSGLIRPLPPSPNSRRRPSADEDSYSLSDVSEADSLALEARQRSAVAHDALTRQYWRDREPLVSPQVDDVPPAPPEAVRQAVLPFGASGVMSTPREDRALRHLSAYRTAYKIRMCNECAARRAMPRFAPAHTTRLGAQPVPLYDTERLLTVLERERRGWAWPKRGPPSWSRPATPVGGGGLLVESASRVTTPLSRPTSSAGSGGGSRRAAWGGGGAAVGGRARPRAALPSSSRGSMRSSGSLPALAVGA